MIYKKYELVSKEDGDFSRDFTGFAKARPKKASRLINTLVAFAADRESNGSFLRGSGKLSVFVVPSQGVVERDKEAGALVLVDDDKEKVDVLRFLHPSQLHRWDNYIMWAEQLLRI